MAGLLAIVGALAILTVTMRTILRLRTQGNVRPEWLRVLYALWSGVLVSLVLASFNPGYTRPNFWALAALLCGLSTALESSRPNLDRNCGPPHQKTLQVAESCRVNP